MGRTRTKNRGLPRRVYLRHGAYSFYAPEKMQDPRSGKMLSWIILVRAHEGEVAMLNALASLLKDRKAVAGGMPMLCASFKENKLAEFSKDTRATYSSYLTIIANEFEDFDVEQVTPDACFDFLDNNFAGKANTAHKYKALLVKLFKYAIARPLRLIQVNPMADIDMSSFKMEVRKKLPTHEQIGQIRAAGLLSVPRSDTGAVQETQSGPMFACLIDAAYLCWQRAGDVRMLTESQIADGYIRFKPSKTAKSSGKVVDVLITPALQKVLNSARAIKKEAGIESAYLFPTRDGTPYTKSGLFSMWRRARDRAGITDGIWFRDLRALAATDAAESNVSTADLQTRLAHTDSATSKKYVKRVVADVSNLDSSLPW